MAGEFSWIRHLIPVITPTKGVDPRDALATSMQAAPGVYAVLLGSGMSKAAGIPTGWEVLQDLVRRVATSEGVPAEQLADAPERWWRETKGSEPRYDTLLAAIATTETLRRTILRRYFEPSGAEMQGAHDALAKLCADGRVRLLLTTNFDKLIERALERAGVTPQIVHNEGSIKGMIPLTQSGVTLVKLNGDYADSPLRNTPVELSKYSPATLKLLAQSFDEFGLVVIGWSAEYDSALVQALEASPSRRYPMYWCSYRGDIGEQASRLLTSRAAIPIQTDGAEEFLTDLNERVGRLETVAARRSAPSVLHQLSHFPNFYSPPLGWDILPTLYLRVAADSSPVPVEQCDRIRRPQRDAIVLSLMSAEVSKTVSGLEPWLKKSGAAVVLEWPPPPAAVQSGEVAVYRLGDGTLSHPSALAVTQLPHSYGGDCASFTVDIGMSLSFQLQLPMLVQLLKEAVILTSVLLPKAIESILPRHTEVARLELHLGAPQASGANAASAGYLLQCVDFSSLGSPPSQAVMQASYGVADFGPMTSRRASEIVADAIEDMALERGFLDSDRGVTELRRSLGLS